MRKAKAIEDEVRPGYTREDFPGGLVRGKYVERLKHASNVVMIRPEISKVFPNEEAVNNALQSLIDIASATTRQAK